MTHETNRAHRGQTIRGSGNEWSRMRLRANLSISDLARLSGIARTVVGLIDQGRLIPSPEEARKWTAATERDVA